MRKFKTSEAIEQERKEALRLVSRQMPTDAILLIYARQSTKGQTIKNKESALQQTEEQLEWGITLGWPEERCLLFIENQAKDGTIRNASGRLRIDEREGLSTVMAYIENDEANAVMARDVARFFRDEDLVGPVVFAKACKDHDVLVITEDYTYDFCDNKRGRDDYKKFIQEAQAAAEFLEKHVKNVLLKNKERKANRGEFWGYTLPVGYLLDKDRTFYVPNTYKATVTSQSHAEVVNYLFKRFRALGGDTGLLRREIVGKPIFPDLPLELIEQVGRIALTKVPGGWTIKTRLGLIGILTNPAYIGHLYHNGRIVKKDAHAAIVNEDDFWYAYYRLAERDLEGNVIERPEGVTKRYQQANHQATPTLLSGLRYDKTPVLTTNMRASARVYARYHGATGQMRYEIVDDREVKICPTHVRIDAATLDRFLSERTVFRMEEALKNNNNPLPDNEDTELIENRRNAIHQEIFKELKEVETSADIQPNPVAQLEETIAETELQIADKERKLDVAGSVMSDVDLTKTYESLKRLRLSLALMKKKLGEIVNIEIEQQKAKATLPETYKTWSSLSVIAKQRFIRVATIRVTLDKIRSGWLKLTVEWSPVLGGNLIDEAYIWSQKGTDSAWTQEEKSILEEHYTTASREWLEEQLPERSWNAMTLRGRVYGTRGRTWEYAKDKKIPFPFISKNEWEFIQENTLPIDELIEKRVYWREYIDMPLIANKEALRWWFLQSSM